MRSGGSCVSWLLPWSGVLGCPTDQALLSIEGLGEFCDGDASVEGDVVEGLPLKKERPYSDVCHLQPLGLEEVERREGLPDDGFGLRGDASTEFIVHASFVGCKTFGILKKGLSGLDKVECVVRGCRHCLQFEVDVGVMCIGGTNT